MKHLVPVFLLVSGICTSAMSQWMWRNPSPPGVHYSSIKFVNTSVGYAAGEKGVVIKTTDGGSNWAQLSFPSTCTINALSFSDANTGWAAADTDCVYVTTNGGQQWTLKRLGATYGSYNNVVNWKAVQFVDAKYGWLAGNGYDASIYKTRDGGNTWTRQSGTSGTTVTPSAIFFLDTMNGWLACNSMLRRTTNGGNTWTTSSISVSISNLHCLVFKSKFSGWMGDDYGILKTTDGGVSWVRATGTTNNYFINSLSFADSMKGWAGSNYQWGTYTDGKIFSTSDGGSTWNLLNAPNHASRAVWFHDANNGISLGGNGAAYKTTDGGTTWPTLKKGTVNGLKDLCVVMPAIDWPIVWAVGDTGTALKSVDGGITWSQSSMPTKKSMKYVHFPTPAVGYASEAEGGTGELQKTTDGGATWAKVSSGNGGAVYFFSADTGVWGGYSNIYRTTDGGKSWVSKGTPTGQIVKIQFVNGNSGYALSTTQGLYKTTDRGLTWIKSGTAPSSANKGMYFIDMNMGWCVGNSGTIMKTTNAGTTWISQSLDQKPAGLDLYGVAFTDSLNGFAVGGPYAQGVVYRTTDGGKTKWYIQSIGTSRTLNAVCLYGSNGYIVGEEGVLLSTTNTGITGVKRDRVTTPSALLLEQNYPNPFNPATTIRFSLPARMHVQLTVYNALGQIAQVLSDEEKESGQYETLFDASRCASGIYFYRIVAGSHNEVKKMMLLR